MCFFGAKHQTPLETIKIPQFWHIGDLFRPFCLAAMTIFPEKGRISEMAIFAFVDFPKFLKIIKLTFFENFKQFLGSSPISICSLRGPGWFFTKNLDHPIFPSEIAWMPSYTCQASPPVSSSRHLMDISIMKIVGILITLFVSSMVMQFSPNHLKVSFYCDYLSEVMILYIFRKFYPLCQLPR